MIGGLIVATIATLMFVPVIFSLAHRRDAEKTSKRAATGAAPEEVHA